MARNEALIQYYRGNIIEAQKTFRETFKIVKQYLSPENTLKDEFRKEYYQLFNGHLD